MSILPRVLTDIAAKHVEGLRSGERDCRLIFPGLTESLAVELQDELRRRLATVALDGATGIPVYLALDYRDSGYDPDEAKGWLHYEAVTSVRHGGFVAVCMPKVLPKLHDSIRGTGSPIRGLTFADEWPWNDTGAEAFRFNGPVLDAILKTWTTEVESRRWIRELILDGLLPATAPFRDAVRVPLFLEEILGSFDPTLYPELDTVVDKFCFHCGIPRMVSHEKFAPVDHVEAVVRTAKALDEQRSKNPEFRDYLVNEVAASTFAGLEADALQRFKDSLDLMLDGALELGVDAGVLAYRGGLGRGSSSKSVAAWFILDVDSLKKLLGVGERDEVWCTGSLPEGRGFLSTDGRELAIFEGASLELDIAVKIGGDRFVPGEFRIRCKRRQRQIYEQECDEAEFHTSVIIPPNELPGTQTRLSLVVQLVRFHQVVNEARVFVHVCGTARPAMAVFEPGFDVVDLLDPEPDSADSDSVMLTCREPVLLHVLDWEATDASRVSVDEELLAINVVEGPAGGEAGPTRYTLREAVDVESFPGGRADLRVEASGLERWVTLAGEDVEPGEFTLEDELRVAMTTTSASRLRRVLPFFRGDGDLVLPKLGELDAASRRRMDLSRGFEGLDGWKPILVDFVQTSGDEIEEPVPQRFWRTAGATQAFLHNMEPTELFHHVLLAYANSRAAVIKEAVQYVEEYATPSERPLYVVAPNYVARNDLSIEAALSEYLEAYAAVLNLLQDDSLSAGEVFTLVHLDSVVLKCTRAADGQLDLRVSLLGPWHPLVVAKRFMVQHSMYAAAEGDDRLAKQHRRLASLFERVDGFRVVPGLDPDGLGLDVSFAFPTSDPGWHLAVSSGAFSALGGSTFGSLRGFGEHLRRSLGLRSSLYLSGADLWSESFVRSFQRSHPSRRQLGLRVSRGLDARPVVDSCARLLDDQQPRSSRLGELLPGGIHLFLEDRLDERHPLPWQQPGVFLYEGLEDAKCYEHFRPDILLLPQPEETRPAWLAGGTEEGVPVPRGRDRHAVFSMPLVDLSTDRDGLPVSRVLESGGISDPDNQVAQTSRENDPGCVGEAFRIALSSIDALASQVRPQRPALVQGLGVPPSLRCDWTVLPGTHVDAGALATYIIGGGGAAESGERALWDYRLNIGRSVSSYYIVCKVPRSLLSSLAAKSLALGPEDASSVLRDLAEVGFAVGETMRSGKAAVGVLGVVGALRLARAAWAAGEANGRRWCTVLLPVDCFTDLLAAPSAGAATRKRTDLLAVNLAWATEGPTTLRISPCAVECKYVSTTYPAGTVQDALGQAEATYQVVSQLISLAQSERGMHARLALGQILRFGLRLLAARGDATTADEQVVLESVLSGSFELLPAIAPTLLVTTSCGARGMGAVDVRAGGWWVQLTADSWPREVPPTSDRLVGQLSQVFPAIEQPTGAGATGQGDGGIGTEPSERAHTDRTDPPRVRKDGKPPSRSGPDVEGDGAPAVRVEGPQAPPHDSETSHQVGVPSDDLLHPTFNGFVGNRAAVEALSIQLRYVEQTGAMAIRSVGLFGPKSTGKTELSRRLARALGVPYLPLSETGLGDIDQLAQRMQERAREAGKPMTVASHQGGQAILRSPPLLVFIDEVHQLSQRVQDTLLPLLEADDRMLRGSSVIIDVREVSFVIATTDWGKLREPFRSRVRAIELDPYSTQEVAQMLRFRIEAATREGENGADVDPAVAQLGDDALVAIATAARAVPRVALDLLREIGMALRIRICEAHVDSVWGHLQRMVPCDRQGLTTRDHKYLRIVANRGPIGLDNLATELGVDRSNVEGAIEPFLVQMGWVQRGPSGRTLTTTGRRVVARAPQPDR